MDPLTLGSFVFFTAMVGLLTWLLTRNDRHDTSVGYFLAGRTLTGGYIAGSLLLTNLSTEQLVGLNGSAFSDGISVMAWEVIAGVSLVIMGLIFLPIYLRCGITTIPEFLEMRYDSATRSITSFIFIIAYAVLTLPIILYTGATGLNGILDMKTILGTSNPQVELWVMVWMVGILGSIYAIFGGLRTVAVSDTLNGFGLLVGGIAISWFGLKAINADSPLAAIATLREAHPEKFNSLGSADQQVPFSTLFTGVLLLNLFYWCTNQQIIQRAFAASTLKEGQKGVLIAGVLKILAPLILVLPGIIAFHLYSAEDLKADQAYGHLVRNVLPPHFRGFFAAVVVGAILSSFNSVLNSTATMFSLGVYKKLLKPDATEAQVIDSGKRFGWIIAIASMLAAPLLQDQKSIFAYLQTMNGLYFIPIFAVVVAGLVNRRVPAWSANLSLIAGCVIMGVVEFVTPIKEAMAWLHSFHFFGIVFAGLVIFMFIASTVSPRPTRWVPSEDAQIDLTPWKPAIPIGLALITFVLCVYVYFADFSVVASK
ncbi:MAG: solute:sodium symporter family transporter [Planctomyces sp.]|nr:solute:sodium symporter family transporter [Planctomyces sp.]